MKHVLLAILLCAATASARAEGPPLLIGEVAPLTGPAATVGMRLSNVSKLWVEEVNGSGGIGGRRIELLTCNDENRPEKAVACTRDLIDKGVVMILANALTASLRAMQPLVRQGPIMLIPSPNLVPPPQSYAFQVSPSDLHNTQAIATYMKANGLTQLGMVAATDASGEVGVESARQVFGQRPFELRLARIDLRANDATTQLAQVASPDVKLVYSSYTGAGAATVVKSFKNLGLPQPLMVSYGNISQSFVDLIKDVRPPRLLGTSLAALLPDELADAGERQRAKAFQAAYAKRYRERPDMINVLGKLSVDVAEAVLRQVKEPGDFAAAKRFLESTPIPSIQNQRFSPSSHVSLDASHVLIVELKGDTWVKADPLK